jgi:hypothetical protein
MTLKETTSAKKHYDIEYWRVVYPDTMIFERDGERLNLSISGISKAERYIEPSSNFQPPDTVILGGRGYWKRISIPNIKEVIGWAENELRRMENGETALVGVVENGQIELCRSLVKNGANVNAKDKYGKTMLMMAAVWTPFTDAERKGQTEICRFLIEEGADVNAKDNDGKTALLHASLFNRNVIRLLIGKGADINASDNEGKTVLMKATAYYRLNELCMLLMDMGADVNARDNDDRTVLKHAEISAKTSGYYEKIPFLKQAGAKD